MSKTTFLGYVPSLKSKHEATIVGHKAIQSKGGSIRYTLQGEYQGRKTLPKTVSKADFEGIYGFDAKEAEAVIISGKMPRNKEENRIHIKDVMEKDGFIPKEIIEFHDVMDISSVAAGIPLGKNYSNHHKFADTVGNPSPASVEPPAPSEKPFPQEPSNENFSAEMIECGNCDETFTIDEGLDIGGIDYCEECYDTLSAKEESEEPEIEYYDHVELEEIDGKLIVSLNNIQFFEGDAGDLLEDVRANSNWEWLTADQLGALSEADVLARGSYSDDGEFEPAENVVYAYTDYQISDWFQELKENGVVVFNGFPVEKSEVKEAFGFGKEDEEEEEEPKTQEFTVVLQEGDKLELTDVEEEQAAPDDENTEKEAETLEITDIDWETDDEDVDLPASVLVPSSVVEDEIADYLSDEYGFLVRGYVLNAETYEAVQAKVTRPVKEDETEDDEESEGLSTLAKVGLGVGALAVGAAIFGAEGEYPQEFLDEFYDFDSNPTADTQDEETLAIAYAAWLESKRNEENIPYQAETDYTEIYGATSGDGYISHDRIDTEEQRTVELRHDNPTTYYNWNSPYDVDDTEVEDAIESELGDEPGEGNYGATVEVRGSKYSQQGQKYVDVDVDMDTDYGDSRFMGLAAESFEAGNMMVKLQEVDGEAPYYNCPYCRNELTVLGGKGGIVAVCENESRCNGLEIPRQYLDDYEKYHWYVNERSSAENFSAESFEAEGMTHDEQVKHYNELHPLERELVNIWETTYELGTTRGYYHEILSDYGVRGLNLPTWNDNPNHSSNWPPNPNSADIKGFWDSSYNEWRDSMVKNESRFKSLPLLQVSLPKNAENFSADFYCTKCDEGFDSITPTDEGQFCESCLPSSAIAHDDMDATTQKDDFGADSNSKNLKMALGITAVGIGLAAVLGKEKIKTLFDRFRL